MSRNPAPLHRVFAAAIVALLLVTDVRLLGSVPSPVPPQYDKLKDLHLAIPVVTGGQPSAAIVVPASGLYSDAAAALQGAIEKQTGVKVPIVRDNTAEAVTPIQGHRIVLGNRSTNRTINALYDLHYCLVDLKYPGPGGYVIRSVHNPFGNGHSVVIVGASDTAGVAEGAAALADTLSKALSAEGDLSIGWTMITKLGKGVSPPTNIEDFETWEASHGYGSVGYFGWCSISKQMAMYYMTGDPLHAREVVRLSFPDERAIADIERIDGERIENKRDPLAGFYHYNAQFGPGRGNDPRAYMRDMDVADVNGDGKMEIVVGTAAGLIVALDDQCRRMWSRRLPSPPVSVRCVRSSAAETPRIVVGCDDGTVAALDETGRVIALGRVTGRPMHLNVIHTPAGLAAVFATDQGEVQALLLGPS